MGSKKNDRYTQADYKASKLFLIPSFFALILSAVMIILFKASSLIPGNLILVISFVIIILLGLTLTLALIKNRKTNIISIVLGIILSIFSAIGIFGIHTTTSTINSIANATYQIDNMVVVVDTNDTSENIYDAIDYIFGYQSSVDTDNTQIMIDEIENLLGQSITLVEYDSVLTLGQALLDSEVHAIIYNEAFDVIMSENIEDFSDSVRILYEHGISVEIETEIIQEDSDENDDEIVSEVNSFNMYISGIDTYGSISKTSRSDVNIIVTVNVDTKEILLTTTPRDTYLTLSGVSGEKSDKLTHAGIYGIETSVSTLEDFYDIEIDYYTRVNFSSVIEIVDSLGGISVYSDYSFSTDNYSFYSGWNTMTGAQALEFARERYSFSDGDFQRGRNQQAVIEGMISKALEPSVLVQLTDIIASVSDCVETSMSTSEIAELISTQIKDGSSWTIETQELTGTTGSSYCYSLGANASVVYADDDSIAEITNQINEVLTNTVD